MAPIFVICARGVSAVDFAALIINPLSPENNLVYHLQLNISGANRESPESWQVKHLQDPFQRPKMGHPVGVAYCQRFQRLH